MYLDVQKTWDGVPLSPADYARFHLSIVADALVVDVAAPYHGDPVPRDRPGSTDHLWEHEVVELFLLGEDCHYLEMEFGPHGHYLVLRLHGIRQRASDPLPADFKAHIDHGRRRWSGRASVPLAYLPEGFHAANAYAIHGPKQFRHYHAAFPVPGPAPDFHQPDAFGPARLSLP